MDRQLFDATQITPSTTIKWTVLVQSIERRNARKKQNGPLYRNYLVTDTKGTKIPIVVFDGNVAHFANTLIPFKRYYVSNATVKETLPVYKVVEYPYTWTLYRKNLVEPHIETIPPPLPCTFLFDKFNDFYRYADQERSICIKALLIHVLPVQETGETTSTRDFVVINEEMVPMLLRAWDDLLIDTDINIHARYKLPTLIVAYGLKVTTHNGLSLKTKSGAYILENPPLNEQLPLKEWFTAHAANITELLENRAYKDPAILFHPPRPSEILPLNFALASMENAKTVWTEGYLSYLPGQGKLWFEACAKCLTPLDVGADWKIMCSICQEFTTVCVRKNGPTVVEATIKSPEVDRLLPFTGNELKIAAEKNKPLTKEVEAALKDKHIICFLKYYDRESRGTMLRRYPVLKIYTEAEVAEYNSARQTVPSLEHPIDNPIPVQHIGSSSTAPEATAETAFFTPSTKAVLEEVARNPSLEHPQTDQASGVKRMLPFELTESVQPMASTAVENQPSLSPEHDIISAAGNESDTALQTTPSKKMKGKDKQA